MGRALQIAAMMIVAACGGTDEGGPSRSSTSGSGGAGGISGGASGSSASGGGFAPAPSSAGQLARCSDDADCSGGLSCYTFGRYCSRSCATDTDCASLGAYTCYVAPGFGMMGGGPMGSGSGGAGGAGGGTGTMGGASGLCRIECQGTSDTSCPQGLMCIDVGGGMMPTYRCAYPPATGGAGMGGAGMGGAGMGGPGMGGAGMGGPGGAGGTSGGGNGGS